MPERIPTQDSSPVSNIRRGVDLRTQQGMVWLPKEEQDIVLSMVCHVVALLNVQANDTARVAGPANSINRDVAPLSHTCCWPIAVIT